MAGPSGRLSDALAGLADGGDRTGWVQTPVALMILAAPVVCVALFALSPLRSVPGGRRRRLRLDAGLLPLAALGLYAFYESGISVYTSIRVDSLPVYPALCVALLSWTDRRRSFAALMAGCGGAAGLHLCARAFGEISRQSFFAES